MQQEKMIPAPDMMLARELFAALRDCGTDGHGVMRDSYGMGEQRAHDLVAQQAHLLGLKVSRDDAQNLYVTLPGRRPGAPKVMTGSHLDSVPRGGNYDGAAGVVAGMAVLAAWKHAGVEPECDVCVMGIRAEESAWFPVSYVGSKSAFGILDASALQCRRADTHETLSVHLSRLGGHPDALAAGVAHLRREAINCFIELHIEQGPVLIGEKRPVGVVTGICGSLRYREARVLGNYAHSGATPRLYRHDAVVALAMLIARLQQYWKRMEAEGHELTLTFGKVNTHRVQADFSKVSGEAAFCIDIRSRSTDSLHCMDAEIQRAVRVIGAEYGVSFELGPQSGSQPAIMDEDLRSRLCAAAKSLKVDHHVMPSGAGHDSATFANQGVPTAMLFVRNANGSHNPEEALDMQDFSAATSVLGHVLAQRAGVVTQGDR